TMELISTNWARGSNDLGQIGQRAGQPVDLVDDHDIALEHPDSSARSGAALPGQTGPGFRRRSRSAIAQRPHQEARPALSGGYGVDPIGPDVDALDQDSKRSPARRVRPKNRGPDQCAPVIFSAITVSER